MTPKFRKADEVEYVFGITLTGNQYIMVENYIQNGIRPEAGCSWCDSGYIRVLTSEMDQFIIGVEAGREKWPLPTDEALDVPELADKKSVPSGKK
jgi:hypothetical protein